MNQPGNTVGGALSQWLEEHSLGRKPRTIQFNREIVAIIRSQWTAPLNASLGSVTRQHVAMFAQQVAHYCPSRWNAIVSVLRFAVPEAAAALNTRPLRSKERPMLSQMEFARLCDELDRRPQSQSGLVIRFLAHTGLRINEARQIRWADVLEDSIRVPANVAKNGRGRVIPFVNGIQSTLDRLRAIAGEQTLVLPQREAKRSLRQACERAGLPRLSHHDFRHLFATRCIQSGVDIPTVARWLGHSDGGALLARLYFHLVDEHGRRMAAKVVI